jgi:hypothetical protein
MNSNDDVSSGAGCHGNAIMTYELVLVRLETLQRAPDPLVLRANTSWSVVGVPHAEAILYGWLNDWRFALF